MKIPKIIVNIKPFGKLNRWAGFLGGIMAAFCCSIGYSQQLIYSNAFNGATLTINGIAPTVANSVAGGTNNAVWISTFTNSAAAPENGTILGDGTIATNPGCALLAFKPQSGAIYYMNASLTVPSGMHTWAGIGLSQNAGQTNNATGSFSRFNDTPNGYAWMNSQVAANWNFWGGPKAADASGPAANYMPGAGTYSFTIILNTFGSHWIASGYVNGVLAVTNVVGGTQVGTNIVYSSNPPIGYAGLGQASFAGASTAGIQWNYWTLSTLLQPAFARQPASGAVSAGIAFTNTVLALADTNQGPLSYQWYTNGVAIGKATNATLVLNPVTSSDAGNYMVVVTNDFGATTSLVATVTVSTTPSISTVSPISYTNTITLFGGTNSDGTNFLGSTPTFSVSASGGVPLAYQWYTNGVAAGGATNVSFTFTNAQISGPTNFTVVVTNDYGSASVVSSVAYLPTPQAPYPQAVLAAQPVAFWRLNEQAGTLADDYQSGNNGIYNNVVLDKTGYNPAEPGESSVAFGSGGGDNSYVGQIENVDFAAPNGSNAEFTVEAWVQCIAADAGAPVITQGTNGINDAFGLGADTNASQRNFQFYVRSASGTVYTADSSVQADDGNWHHLVGVCDEANGNLLLYIDGNLIKSASIPAKSGLYEAAAPVTIGAGTQNAASGYNLQFFGYIDDVAAYNYALSAGQITGQYGGNVPLSFVSPLPPTNAVYQANGTLTIPATAIGEPPVGYYWTNLMTGEVLGSGTVSVLKNLNATLTIPNAPASLSGDQLALVVTNSSGSTNWFVTLFSPAPPVTLGYTDPILYSNDFNGGTWTPGGMPLTAVNSLVGGTNITWTDALGTNDTGSMLANGVDGTSQDSWLLPLTPEPGYVYTITASLTFNGPPGNWVGLGYAQRIPTNAAVGYGVFSDGGSTPPDLGPNGYDWIILTEGNGNVQYFVGPTAENAIIDQTPFFTPGPGTHTVQVVLATTNAQWSMAAYVDGVQASTNYTYTNNPPIGAIGITQNGLTAPDNVQWNYFSLSQVAPGGVPPYLLSPLPPSSVLLTNATVTIPATVFGSAPLGYYWSFNNSTVLASGITNNLSPLSADLSVPSSSLGSGQLELTVTNAYGTNTTLVTLVSPVNSIPTNIVTTVTNNSLYLTWPVDHIGWQLQAQTNSLGVGISTNWANYNPSTGTNQVVIPINPTNGAVFYRLIYTP